MAADEIVVEHVVPGPRALVWALLVDTNRYDRALGLSAARYAWREIDGRRRFVGHAQQSGIVLEWIEEPYEWIEGRFLAGRRLFLRGPASEGGLRIQVTDEGDGTRARVVAFGEAKSWILRLLNPLVRAGLRRRIAAYLQAVARTAVDGPAPPPAEPPVTTALALLETRDEATLTGGRARLDEAELARRTERLAKLDLDPTAVERLVAMLRDRPDEEVAQMRPFALARRWGLDRRAVLRTFLHATQAGLTDLSWQLNCPVCKVSAGVVRTLAEVGRDIHCEACNIRYDVDFAANVEAVFRCNHGLRAVEPAVFCAASPVFRPHVLAQIRVDAGQTRREGMALTDGRVHVRTLGSQRAADLHDPVAPAIIRAHVTADAVELSAEGISEGETMLEITSALDEAQYVSFERGAWSSEQVVGSVIASFPEFIDLFATEAPAAGLELSVASTTFLFSDLTGSTALYERVGDARAYAIVQEHFGAMTRAVTEHRGAIVKTMGDAVMATFGTPQDAIAAAIAAMSQCLTHHHVHGVGLKLGLYEGPCMAVRANDRLDYFGTTVNMAARLQARAGAGELVVARGLVDQAAVAQVLARYPSHEQKVQLKGIAAEQTIVAFDLTDAGSEAAK